MLRAQAAEAKESLKSSINVWVAIAGLVISLLGGFLGALLYQNTSNAHTDDHLRANDTAITQLRSDVKAVNDKLDSAQAARAAESAQQSYQMGKMQEGIDDMKRWMYSEAKPK